MGWSPQKRYAGGMSKRWLTLLAGAFALSACASVSYDRRTQTSGTFEAKGMAFTILSIDLPKRAVDIARENASDSNLANLVVEEATVSPDWGRLDFLLDIIGVRRATIRGTWGFDQE